MTYADIYCGNAGHLIWQATPPRLSPLTVAVNGDSRALLSVVLFLNTKFRSAVFPSPSLTMGQINYRTYVLDDETGRHGIWFLGTLLSSWAFVVPRLLWHMPWRKGTIRLDWERDDETGLYRRYEVEAADDWAPAAVRLVQEKDDPLSFPGFPDEETALVYLTHAFYGFYRRRDGRAGVNRVWHEPMEVKSARLVDASFPLLDRLELLPFSEQLHPYNVLLAPTAEFMSLLPPKLLS